MPMIGVNGATLYHHAAGVGEPMVLVHGSWTDHHDWDLVFSGLAAGFRVVTYDRRGHSASEAPPAAGSLGEDAADLAGLVEALGLGPAHVVGHSYGGVIVLHLATQRPGLFRTMAVHEAPVFGSFLDDPELGELATRSHRQLDPVIAALAEGNYEEGARRFVDDIIFGPGAWETRLTLPLRRKFIQNAPTFLDELRDPTRLKLDLAALAAFDRPVLISYGGRSRNHFPHITRRLAAVLPQAETHVFEDAAHVPQVSHPESFVAAVTDFIHRHPTAGRD
ncbi:MAG: alpha/beta hydrolase [Dehalococcoidia bacterium]|nr:alpha/beta hydrolase [Dehalococcoidia bacterium]